MKSVLISMLQLHKNSGSAKTCFENIQYFKSRGFIVHVVSMTLNREFVEGLGAVPHKTLPWIKGTGLARRKWYNFQVQRLAKKLNVDIVLGHGDIFPQDVLTLHNCVYLASELIDGKALDEKSEMAIVHGKILKDKKFKKVIANSKFMKKDLIDRFHIPAQDITVIYPSLEAGVFTPPTNEEKNKYRKIFGFPEKVVVSLVTSGNFKKRGLHVFIEAINKLPSHVRDMADFRLLGKDDFSAYGTNLISHDKVVNDVENYFKAIDVFVLPALIEEFGRVVSEAMASGLPVITTKTVGAGELISEESREFVINPGSVDELANALEKMILSKELRDKNGLQNAKAVAVLNDDNLFPLFDSVFKSL